jgi:hypothetical protein
MNPGELSFEKRQPLSWTTSHAPGSGTTRRIIGGHRFPSSAECSELRRKLADVDAKLRQLTTAERNRQH